MFKSKFVYVSFAVAALSLSGCGGGGSDSGTTTAVTSFPLQAGYKVLISAGAADNFSISGTCTGTANITTGAATTSTFEGVVGYAAPQTVTINVTNCTLASNAVTGTNYYDSNYTPLGSNILGVEYAKFLTQPPAIPASVKVGDTAVYATFTTYTNSTKTTPTGQSILSYVIESDTSVSAIVNLISKDYDLANQLLFTQQTKYRVVADGSLTILSIDVQYSTTSTNHLLFTKS